MYEYLLVLIFKVKSCDSIPPTVIKERFESFEECKTVSSIILKDIGDNTQYVLTNKCYKVKEKQ